MRWTVIERSELVVKLLLRCGVFLILEWICRFKQRWRIARVSDYDLEVIRFSFDEDTWILDVSHPVVERVHISYCRLLIVWYLESECLVVHFKSCVQVTNLVMVELDLKVATVCLSVWIHCKRAR